jgi:hypothetical protein
LSQLRVWPEQSLVFGVVVVGREYLIMDRTGINYDELAVLAVRYGSRWEIVGEMPLSQAVMLAVRKYRVHEEPRISTAGLHLVGIDSIMAVFNDADFPMPPSQFDAASASRPAVR